MTPGRITEHFTLEEFTHSQTAARNGIDNSVPEALMPNLLRLAEMLEAVRKVFGRAVFISSGYRCERVNQLVGSTPPSRHCLALAADFTILPLTPDSVTRTIAGSELPFDQVILEFDHWTHLSVAAPGSSPRAQALIIDRAGTRLLA